MFLKVTANNCNTGNFGDKRFKAFIMLSNKGGPLQKVLGRITTQGKFRKNSQVTALVPRFVSPGKYLLTIVSKIPDNRVYLHQSNFHFPLNRIFVYCRLRIIYKPSGHAYHNPGHSQLQLTKILCFQEYLAFLSCNSTKFINTYGP